MKPNSSILAASAWEDLTGTLSRYSPALYRLALRRLGNREDAEDAVQDALLCAFTHISQFKGRSHISTWLYRIVVNSAGMQLRRRKDRAFLSLSETGKEESLPLEDRLADSGLNPEQVCGQTELRGMVQQSLKDLSPRLRKALQMRDLDGMSTAESAQVAGVTQNALKARSQRARRRLGMLLADRGVAGGIPNRAHRASKLASRN